MTEEKKKPEEKKKQGTGLLWFLGIIGALFYFVWRLFLELIRPGE